MLCSPIIRKPLQVHKAGHLCAYTFLHEYICVPKQALGWFTLGLGLVVEDEPSELSHTYSYRDSVHVHVAHQAGRWFLYSGGGHACQLGDGFKVHEP